MAITLLFTSAARHLARRAVIVVLPTPPFPPIAIFKLTSGYLLQLKKLSCPPAAQNLQDEDFLQKHENHS
jgi:hypothetical protein